MTWGIGGLAAAGALGLWGVVVFSSGCGQQSLQGCSAPGLRNEPITVASSVGSLGPAQTGSAGVSTTAPITLTFNQPMDTSTLKGLGNVTDAAQATVLLEQCGGGGQPGGGCSTSTPTSGKVTAYDSCTATATYTLAGALTQGTQYVLAIPGCSTSDGLCSTQTLARDTSGRPVTTGFGGLCGSISRPSVCIIFSTAGGATGGF